MIPRPTLSRVLVASLFLAPALFSGGCLSSKFQKAEANMLPAVQLNLRGDGGPVDVFVDSVIVYRGPGSWKQHAFWDEYVVSIVNRPHRRTTVLSATLFDAQGFPIKPGDDWFQLERESRAWWESHALAQNLALGASTVLAGAAAVVTPVSVLLLYAAANGVALGSTAIAVAAAPVAALALLYRNAQGQQAITAEFDRRRIQFPLTLAPHQSQHGSLFFRLTPSPQKLVVTYRDGPDIRETAVNLAVLSDLHRKPDPE